VQQNIGVQALSGKINADQESREIVEGIVVNRIAWPKQKFLRFIRTPFDLFSVLYRERHTYDIVHLHQFSWFGIFVILAARLLHKPVLIKLSSIGPRSLPGIAKSRFGALQLAIFKSADALVAMSAENLVELEAARFPSSRVLRTPNGIRIFPTSVDAVAHSKSQDACRVVFVGRLSAEKRVDDLLHAWQKVVGATPTPAILELWGNGPAEQELKSLCSTLGITESVFFRGHVDFVRDQLPAMDVFVLTSNREGNSNAILEAMAAGLPIVSTRVGGTPMQVGAEGARFLITPGDRDALCDRLLELISDPALRKSAGDQMRNRALVHFDITVVAQTYAAAYRLISAGRRDDLATIGNPVISTAG
jgi:glycosyltransferase involved in cell wall biosynthesis